MARVALTVNKITIAGSVASAVDGVAGSVADGNVVNNNDGERVFVAVKNSSVDTAYDVTFVTPGTVGSDALAIADKVTEIAFGVKRLFGPFPLATYTKTLQIDVENAALKLEAFSI